MYEIANWNDLSATEVKLLTGKEQILLFFIYYDFIMAICVSVVLSVTDYCPVTVRFQEHSPVITVREPALNSR